MFSWDIEILASDAHSLIKEGENKAYNIPEPVIIGNHIWVGSGVKIIKGAVIPDNAVIGAGAVVSGEFTEQNVIITGNPAKVIKRKVNWDRRDSYSYNMPSGNSKIK